MANVPIENVGAFGIIKDASSHTLPPEAWSDGGNVRFIDGKAEKIMGLEEVYTTPTVAPHWLLSFPEVASNSWFYASDANIYQTDGTTHTNVTRYTTTPGDDDYTGNPRPLWTGGVLHGVPFANHDAFVDPPQQWDSALSRFKDLTNWPASTYCKSLRAFKNTLVAMDIQISGTRYPYMIMYSHPADPGSMPSSWDHTDATKLAGRHTIAQSSGFLLDSLPLGDVNVLYKTDAIWGMQYAGLPNIYRFWSMVDSFGALGPRCMREFFAEHFVVGQNDIVTFNGIRPNSVVSSKYRKWFYANLSPEYYDRTVVVPNYANNEMWIAFVDKTSTSDYLTKALIWNWVTGTWSIRDLPDIAFLETGKVTSPASTFDSQVGSFNSAVGTFDGLASAIPADDQLLIAKAYSSNQLLKADSTYTDRGTGYTSYLERTGLAIVGRDRQGRPRTDQSSIKFLRSIYPKIEAATPVTFNVYAGVHDTPSSAVTWYGPFTFNTGTDVKVDPCISGRYLAVKFEEVGGENPWAFIGYNLDIEIVGGL